MYCANEAYVSNSGSCLDKVKHKWLSKVMSIGITPVVPVQTGLPL
jgi:hypothetical protein